MWRRALGIIVLAGTVFAGLPGAEAAADDVPLCRNYVMNAPWGKLTVDVRPRGADPIGTVSWALFIHDLADIPGEYRFREYVNGKPISGQKKQTKTDNLHQVFYRVTDGITLYNSGDEIHLEVFHEANGHTYITPLNNCRVP